jgi:hypothetical protein
LKDENECEDDKQAVVPYYVYTDEMVEVMYDYFDAD